MPRRIVRFVPWVIFLLGSCVLGSEPTTRPAAPESFLRFVDDGHGGGSLQTADVEFQNANGVVVQLIGAVHIGEKDYYDSLNREFRGYDAVLYELIKSRDVPPPGPGEGAKSDSAIGQFQ